MKRMFQFITGVLLICACSTAFAGEWSDKCKTAGDKSAASCKATAGGATAADNAQAAGAAATVGASSTVNPGAGASKKQGADQAARLTGAKNKCEKDKEECEKECDNQEKQRDAKSKEKDAKGNPTQKATEAQKDEGPLKEKKKSACLAPLLGMMGDLGKGAGDAASSAADAAKTGGSSNGMPLPLPIPIPGGGDKDKKDEAGTPGQNPVPDKLNCETAGNSKYSECNNHFTEKCQAAMSTPECSGFINRYCGNPSTPTPPPLPGNDSVVLSAQTAAANAAATANLVADKQGEGLGSAFCKKADAYRYCQAAGRSECPSCKNLNSPWPQDNAAALADGQKACPTDPIFSDPAVLAKLKDAPVTTTPAAPGGTAATGLSTDRFSATPQSASSGGGSSGGIGQGAGGAGSVGAAPGQGVAEGAGYSGPSLANGSGYGGGAGGSYEGSASGPGYEPASVNGNANTRNPANAAASAGVAKDVAGQYGPNIFSIQSTTYRDMCSRGRFLHCRK